MIKEYLFDRREGFVHRWHTEPTIRSESLAEHQFFVTRNTLFICQLLALHKIAYANIALAMNIAIHHDEAEKIIGDMPGPAKREYLPLREAIHRVELDVKHDHIDKLLGLDFSYKFRDFPTNIDESLELQVVKYCDVLDAHIFATVEKSMGNNLLTAGDITQGWMDQYQWEWLCKLRQIEDIP